MLRTTSQIKCQIQCIDKVESKITTLLGTKLTSTKNIYMYLGAALLTSENKENLMTSCITVEMLHQINLQ